MKAAAISLKKLRASRISTVMALRMCPAATGLTAIVRMAEIAGDAVVVRAAAGGIEDAADAVDVPAAADGIVDAAGPGAEDTKTFCHGFARIHTDSHGRMRELTFRRLRLASQPLVFWLRQTAFLTHA